MPQQMKKSQSEWSYAAFNTYPLDIKVSIGSDIVSIYKASLRGERETSYLISIAMCNYDRNPLGMASSNLLNSLTVDTAEGRQERWGGSAGGGCAGAYYWALQSVPVTQADKEVYLVYQKFGEEIQIALPAGGARVKCTPKTKERTRKQKAIRRTLFSRDARVYGNDTSLHLVSVSSKVFKRRYVLYRSNQSDPATV